MADRNEVKALLARAGVEITTALASVDRLSDAQLQTISSKIGGTQAFFDFNGSCGKLDANSLKAFFDFNGSCGGTAGLDGALLTRVAGLGKRGI
jgi:hypothetical protein